MKEGFVANKRILILLVTLLVGLPLAYANGFSIVNVRTDLRENVYQLSAELDFEFTEQVNEAVENGIPVTLEVIIRLEKPQQYWWPEEVSVVMKRFQLQYHALSEQYIVRNLNNGEQSQFSSLYQALRSISLINNLPLIDIGDIADLEDYRLRIRTVLDVSALPVPLRLWAYLDPGWALKSDWHEQALVTKK